LGPGSLLLAGDSELKARLVNTLIDRDLADKLQRWSTCS
jgi:hypothetical protein